jgi:hypothetical protein
MRVFIMAFAIVCSACATTPPAPQTVTRNGTFNGRTEYKVSQEICGHDPYHCSPMAKTCPRGFDLVGYDDQVIVTVPPTHMPRYLYYMCKP